MVILETQRLRLRPLARDDADSIHEIFSDPVAMRFAVSGTRERAQTDEWVELALRRAAETGLGFLAVTLRNDESYLGHAGLLPQLLDGAEELEIGYWLMRRHWGRGYASEAACALRDHALTELNRTRLVSFIARDNTASRGVALRTGMQFERGTLWKGIEIDVYALQRQVNHGI